MARLQHKTKPEGGLGGADVTITCRVLGDLKTMLKGVAQFRAKEVRDSVLLLGKKNIYISGYTKLAITHWHGAVRGENLLSIWGADNSMTFSQEQVLRGTPT